MNEEARKTRLILKKQAGDWNVSSNQEDCLGVCLDADERDLAGVGPAEERARAATREDELRDEGDIDPV